MTPVTTWELAVADLLYAEQSADELLAQLETLERRTNSIRGFLAIHDARLGWAERAGVAATAALRHRRARATRGPAHLQRHPDRCQRLARWPTGAVLA